MNDPYGVIYAITCLVNQKQYVGQTTVGVKTRWKWHRSDAQHPVYPLGRAISKYGPEKFGVEVIDKALDQKELNVKEISWIAKLKTRSPNGYNLTDGGLGHGGFTMPQEAREKIRAAKLGKPMPPEAVEKSRLGHLGKKMSDETRAKMSKASSGRRHTQETRDKIRKALTGRECSPEHIEKNRMAHLKENRSAEGIEKCRQAALNISPENREKLRLARLGKKQSPELVRKRMEGMARARALRARNQTLAPA